MLFRGYQVFGYAIQNPRLQEAVCRIFRDWDRAILLHHSYQLPGRILHSHSLMPHTGTRNQFGTESRKNIIFRIRNKRRQPDKVVTGVSDHPNRGQFGEWLEYEPGNDPVAAFKACANEHVG